MQKMRITYIKEGLIFQLKESLVLKMALLLVKHGDWQGLTTLCQMQKEWIQLSEKLIDYHSKLELSGLDIRINGSSLKIFRNPV